MGASLSWVAVQGRSAAALRAALSLVSTGRFSELAEAPYSGADLKSGWTLVQRDRCDADFLRDKTLEGLSKSCELVAVSLEEHVMASLAEGWTDGRRVWSLSHNSEEGIKHLEEGGSPPKAFAAIKERAFQRQREKDAEGVDYIFDVPLELARFLTGYKHDEDGPDDFEVLEPIPQPGFWSRLFGRRQ